MSTKTQFVTADGLPRMSQVSVPKFRPGPPDGVTALVEDEELGGGVVPGFRRRAAGIFV